VPCAAGSCLIVEHGGLYYDLSNCLDRMQHCDLLQLVERGFFDSFHRLEQDALARRWTAPPPSELLTPLEPRHVGKILALHAPPRELFEQAQPGSERLCFSNRSPATMAASGTVVHLPEPSEHDSEGALILRHETLLAVVLLRRARSVTLDEAATCVAGYMVASDFTQRSLQGRAGANWFGQSPSGTLVTGPAFVPRSSFDLSDVSVGVLRRRAGASEAARTIRLDRMKDDVSLAIAAMSRLAILHAGDVLLVPTGVGLGAVESGDDVRCWVEGIGEVSSTVRRRARLRLHA
jgi:2-keto-4-pentenoate hydratase/2-oxohepta-3-ene-1,7-dioic acid hydratase in catechol pathway